MFYRRGIARKQPSALRNALSFGVRELFSTRPAELPTPESFYLSGATQCRTQDCAMMRKLGFLNIVLCAIWLASVFGAAAQGLPKVHPGPWPIRHWRNHQPRRIDITPGQSRKIDRLYLKIERDNPKLIAPDFRPK
jgi:hypothetical protein